MRKAVSANYTKHNLTEIETFLENKSSLEFVVYSVDREKKGRIFLWTKVGEKHQSSDLTDTLAVLQTSKGTKIRAQLFPKSFHKSHTKRQKIWTKPISPVWQESEFHNLH